MPGGVAMQLLLVQQLMVAIMLYSILGLVQKVAIEVLAICWYILINGWCNYLAIAGWGQFDLIHWKLYHIKFAKIWP